MARTNHKKFDDSAGGATVGYPHHKQEKATETVLDQAALLSEGWATA